MPHIVKYSERLMCVRPAYFDNWEEDLKYKYLRPAEEAYVKGDKHTVFDLIESIVEDLIPKVSNEFFNEFVDIKEVPYGRYNSDSDYRGN